MKTDVPYLGHIADSIVVHDLPRMKAEVSRLLTELGSAGSPSGSPENDKLR